MFPRAPGFAESCRPVSLCDPCDLTEEYAPRQLPRAPGFAEAEKVEQLRTSPTCLSAAAVRSKSRHPPDQVIINVYELVAFGPLNQLLDIGTGIVCDAPRGNRRHRFRETVVLGRTRFTEKEVAATLESMLDEWKGSDYHWLQRNCLSFANDLGTRLGVGRLPPWIDRVARGAGVLHSGYRGLTSSVQELTEGARSLFEAIANGPSACGNCRVRTAGQKAEVAMVSASMPSRQNTNDEMVFSSPPRRQQETSRDSAKMNAEPRVLDMEPPVLLITRARRNCGPEKNRMPSEFGLSCG